MRHKKLLFDGQMVVQLETPCRPGPRLEFTYVVQSIGVNDIWRVPLRSEEPISACRLDPGLEAVHQSLSFRWRSCRRQQKSMVTSCADSRGCPAGKSTKAIYFEPFRRIRHQGHRKDLLVFF